MTFPSGTLLLPNDILVLVFACPHEGSPTALVLSIKKILRRIGVVEDRAYTLDKAVLGCQMQAGHPVVSFHCDIGTRSRQVPDNLRL